MGTRVSAGYQPNTTGTRGLTVQETHQVDNQKLLPDGDKGQIGRLDSKVKPRTALVVTTISMIVVEDIP